MSGGLVASVVASHSPRMGVEQEAPEFIRGLIGGLRELGEAMRALEPDAIVLHSAHWVSTFLWLSPLHEVHKGVCVADEAPDLIPGSPYEWPGEPALAQSVADKLNAENIVCRTFDTPHWNWDYGCYVPLQYMDPRSEIPIVLLPTVLCSDVDENRRVGRYVHEVGKDTGKRIVFVSSCALSHDVLRGPELWPTAERQELDRRFIELATEGRAGELSACSPFSIDRFLRCPSSFGRALPRWEAARSRAWWGLSRLWPKTTTSSLASSSDLTRRAQGAETRTSPCSRRQGTSIWQQTYWVVVSLSPH